NALAQVTGPYTIGSVRYRVRAALTNKNQQGAYRGFGSEVNDWMLEQEAGADGGQGSPRAGPGPARYPPQELHPPLPALHPDRQRLRLRRLRQGPGQGAGAGGLRALAGRAEKAAGGGSG